MKNALMGIDRRYAVVLLFCTIWFWGINAQAQVIAPASKPKPMVEPTINIPLSGGLNPLYYAIPSPLTGDEDNVTYVNINGTPNNHDTQCAQRALGHLKQYINTYVGFMAAKSGLDVGLKVSTTVAKAMPLSGGASLAIDVLSFALKGSMTESTDELDNMIQQEALSKLSGKLTDKINDEDVKKTLNDGIGDLISSMYKKLDDANINKDFPNDCNGHLNIHFVKVGLNKFKMVFKASGDCQCNNKEKPLGKWEVSGEMTAEVTGITQKGKVFQEYRDPEYDMQLSWGKPTFYITADCNCNLHNISYTGGGNQGYAGLSLISEDSDPRFNTYGFDVAFTHFLDQTVGVTADAGINFGSQHEVDYRKFTLMAGLTWIPIQQAALAAKVNIYTHLLLGLSAINASIGTYSATNTTFAGELGAGINIALKKGWYVRPIEINWQFATPKGGLSNNIKFTAGVVADLPFVK